MRHRYARWAPVSSGQQCLVPLLTLLQVGCGWVGRSLAAHDADVGGRELDAEVLDSVDAQRPGLGSDGAASPLDATVDSNGGDGEASAEAALDASATTKCPGAPSDAGLADSRLLLRYDFGGEGTAVADLVGTYDGLVSGGAALDCSGILTLDGLDDFVSMPGGLLSSLESVTVMIWLIWDQSPAAPCSWERAFAFGSSDAGPGNPGHVETSLSLTLSTCPGDLLTGLMEIRGGIERVDSPAATPGRLVQLTLVFDGPLGQLRVYQDGVLMGTSVTTHTLAELRDTDAWIGRSNWIQDWLLKARVDEFRIYAAALNDMEIAQTYASGPDRP